MRLRSASPEDTGVPLMAQRQSAFNFIAILKTQCPEPPIICASSRHTRPQRARVSGVAKISYLILWLLCIHYYNSVDMISYRRVLFLMVRAALGSSSSGLREKSFRIAS